MYTSRNKWKKFFLLCFVISLLMAEFPVSAEAAVKGVDVVAEQTPVIHSSAMTDAAEPTESPKPIQSPQPTGTAVPTPSMFPTPKPEEQLEAPVLERADVDEKGIYIKFSKVQGAKSYKVYIRQKGNVGEFSEVEEIGAESYDAEMAQGGIFLSVEGEKVELGKSYEIMVRSAKWSMVWSSMGSSITGHYIEIFSEDSNILQADMPQQMVSGVTAKALNQSSIKIKWEKVEGVKGYEIQFSTAENGSYQTAANLSGDSVISWVHSGLEIGTTYYYKVYAVGEVTKSYFAGVVKCLVTFEKPKGVKSSMMGPTKMQLKWQKVSGASGYIVYRSETKNNWNRGRKKKYKVLKGGQKTKLNVPKVKNGMCYHYEIMAYTVKGGVTIEGNAAQYYRYADYYGYENESYSDRWKRIYGKKQKEYDYRKSGKYMTRIRVKVWDFARGMSGKKVTRVKTLSVHKKIAPTMKKIFLEIYKGKEKAPIYEIGGYSARSGQHGQGLAIDINSNYNYMVQGKKVLAGSCWKPGKYAYSIKRNGDIEKAFRKYGYSRGLWGKRKDYMHFSYFGT